MNIFYIGSSGALSLVPFRKLLASGHAIRAVGLYKPVCLDNRIIALENDALALAAIQHELPLIDLSLNNSDIVELLSEYDIDIIIMSCYSRRLPDVIVNLAAYGCFNMHPSLLPRYRGPEPIFWQMKNASEMGVSWHQVIHELDAGDIVAQQKVIPHDGDSYQEICLQLAESGTEMLMTLLADVEANRLSADRQHAELASYYPYPDEQDFVVDTVWTAQHAFNFMRATRAFGYKYYCRTGDTAYMLDNALDYDVHGSMDVAKVQGDRVLIPCNDGILIATFTDKIPV